MSTQIISLYSGKDKIMQKIHKWNDKFHEGLEHERVLDEFFRARGWKISEVDRAGQRAGIDRVYEVSALPDSLNVEYKADSRAHITGNLFAETVSVGRYIDGKFVVEKPGWLYTTTADYLFYFLPVVGDILIFKPHELRAYVEGNKGGLRSVSVKNAGYSGRGLLVPIEKVRNVAQRILKIPIDK